MKWPVYKDTQLVLGNTNASTGVLTLWSKREVVARGLDHQSFVTIGNLYSQDRGIDFLLANLLAHPFLDRLLVCGADRSGSGQSLLDFFQNGVREGQDRLGRPCWLVESSAGGRISVSFDLADLDALRTSVEIVDLRLENLSELGRHLRPVSGKVRSVREPKIIDLSEGEAVEVYPSEETAIVARGRTVAEVWLKILDLILKFGVVSGTQFQSQQREILNLISVITDEDSDDPYVPAWFPVERSALEEYYPTVLEAMETPPGVSYCYGERMRRRWGDQVAWAIEALKRSPETRRVVVSLWDQLEDSKSSDPPCLNHLWFRVRQNDLTLTATIRSNDMFGAYPQNALALRKLQKLVANGVGTGIGVLVINSQSAHLYDDTWEASRAIVADYWRKVVKDPRLIHDPRGNFLVSVTGKRIVVEHQAPTGELLQRFEGQTALSLYIKLAPFVSITEHALYLGAELQKAELAIRLGLRYKQDKSLS